MTTSTKNTKKHSTKVFAFVFAVVAALFGAGCEGAEDVEGGEEVGEEAVEMGQTQQAIKGAIGLTPAQIKQKCEDGGRVYDPSTNGCSATCAPGFVPDDKDGYKCVDGAKKCAAKGNIWDASKKVCNVSPKNRCAAEYKVWDAWGQVCLEKCIHDPFPMNKVPSPLTCPKPPPAVTASDCYAKDATFQEETPFSPAKCVCKNGEWVGGQCVASPHTGPNPWPNSPSTSCIQDPSCMTIKCADPSFKNSSACQGFANVPVGIWLETKPPTATARRPPLWTW